MSEAQRQFAHSSNVIETEDECIGCPAVQAGRDPDEVMRSELGKVADRYDQKFAPSGQMYASKEVVTEERARQAWLSAIYELQEAFGSDDPSVEAGLDVAEELGWEDDE
jgi:hypothetical protein